MAYCVVEFVQEKTVSVIPCCWLVTIENEQFCYWPPSDISRNIYKANLPDREFWQKYIIKIIPKTETGKNINSL